jgi:Holliday junction resolvase-like predicted endonuclease
MAQVEQEAPGTLEQEFNELARQWRRETGMLSLIRQKAMHPAYQKIIGMGRDALPLIFLEMRNRSGDWLWALEAIARPKVNPARDTANFKDAVAAWLKWGEENGYA